MTTSPVPVSKAAFWAGWILTILPALVLVGSGAMKLIKPPDLVEEFGKLGLPEHLALYLGIVEFGCAALYLFPRTAVLGAILSTGYFGGAILTHVRLGEEFFGPAVLGVMVWLGLYLRDVRVRALVPWRD